jgi:hypothetical protein
MPVTVRQCASINLPTRSFWWEETIISTHLRHAAGVCVLTTGLLIGSAGGAIAAADTESTGSSTSTGSTSQSEGGADESSQGVGGASAPTASTSPTPRPSMGTALRDVIRKLQLLGKPSQRPAGAKPTAVPVAADTETDNTESDLTSAVTDPVASDSDVVASDSNVSAPVNNAVASDSNVTAPVTNAVASDSNGPSPSTDPIAPPVSKVVQPVTNAVARVAGAVLAVPAVVVSLPTSTTPIADVITMIQNMLISVNDAVASLAQVPSDLYSLLVVAGMDATAVNAVGSTSGAGLSDAAGAALVAPIAPLPPQALPMSPIGHMPLLGDVTAPAKLGGIATAGLSADLSVSGTTPLAAEGARPMDALSLLEHTVRAVLAPASLSALAAFALPGVGGLLIICAAGMRVGYRQAKAALAVRTTGISRFARQGPLGVVCSGSLVALHPRHPRALRVVRPEVSPAAGLLEQAA